MPGSYANSGMTQPSDFGLKIAANSTNKSFVYVAFPIFIMPKKWSDKTDTRQQKVQLRVQVEVAAAKTAYLEWHLEAGGLPSITIEQSYAGAIANVWQTADEGIKHCVGNVISEFPTLPDHDTGPLYVTGYAKVWGSDATAWYIDAVYIESANDQTYTEPLSGGRAMEYIDRDTAANRIYNANRSASSYDAMRCLCHTYNRLRYYNEWSLSVPLFGDASP